MKHFLIFNLLTTALMHSAFAYKEGGGGSQIELDFVQVGRYATLGIQQSMTNQEGLFNGFNLDAFRGAVGSVEIHQVDSLCSNEVDPTNGAIQERCLDASYSPAINQIELSADNWQKKSCIEKMSIAVHEYGRASGNENGDYDYSSQVASSKAIAAQCIPYDNQEGAGPLSCIEKASYLDQSLQSIDSSDTSTTVGLNNYVSAVGSVMSQWSEGFGSGCVEDGKTTCIRDCFLKAGGSCFNVCSGN